MSSASAFFIALLAVPILAPDPNTFVSEAASAGLMEVDLGRVATARAFHQRVKQFAADMVADHTTANAALKEAAMTASIPVPATMMEEHRAVVERLTNLHGVDFDRAYMKAMVDYHEEDLEQFRQQAAAGAQPAVKALAAETLPTLEGHLAAAKEVAAAIAGGPAGTH